MLGDEIRKARMAAGLTQEAVAHRAGVTKNYIGLLETNKTSPTVLTLLRITTALRIKASDLIAAIQADPATLRLVRSAASRRRRSMNP